MWGLNWNSPSSSPDSPSGCSSELTKFSRSDWRTSAGQWAQCGSLMWTWNIILTGKRYWLGNLAWSSFPCIQKQIQCFLVCIHNSKLRIKWSVMKRFQVYTSEFLIMVTFIQTSWWPRARLLLIVVVLCRHKDKMSYYVDSPQWVENHLAWILYWVDQEGQAEVKHDWVWYIHSSCDFVGRSST